MRALVGERPAVGDPRLVAQRRLVGERHDDDGAPLAAGSPRWSGRPACRRCRRAAPPDPSADRQDGRRRRRWRRRAATATPGAVSGERARGSDGSPGRIRSTRQRPSPSGTRSAPSIPWLRAFSGGRGPDVGVRRAELALHLPQQVDEVVGGAEALDQRPVAGEGGVPVDAVHVGAEVVVAHQPPGLVVHLPPLVARRDGDAQPRQVDGRRRRRTSPPPRAPPCGRRGSTRTSCLSTTTRRCAVAGGHEAVDGVEQRLGPPRRQVEALQGRARRIVVEAGEVVAERAGERGAQPREPAGDRGATRRSGRPAPGTGTTRWSMPVSVDGDLARRRTRRARRPSGGAGARPATSGSNGDGVVAASVDQLRPAAIGERQVEHVGVVDRVEAARRQERQVACRRC